MLIATLFQINEAGRITSEPYLQLLLLDEMIHIFQRRIVIRFDRILLQVDAELGGYFLDLSMLSFEVVYQLRFCLNCRFFQLYFSSVLS